MSSHPITISRWSAFGSGSQYHLLELQVYLPVGHPGTKARPVFRECSSSGRRVKDDRAIVTYSTNPVLSLARLPMSAARVTSSSSQAIPPASPPPETPRNSDPDPAPTATTPPEVVAETKPDEPTTSLPPSPRLQSPTQPPGLVDRPAKAESHAPDPAPVHRSDSVQLHAALTTSHIGEERPLPAVPANVTLPPPVQASSRPRIASDPSNGNAQRHFRRSELPPVQPLNLPGSGIFRQRPAIHPAEFESQDGWPTLVTVPSQSAMYPPGSVGARLSPTLEEALKVRDSASLQAKWTTYSINIAIAFQVVLGALTTALGASLQGNSIQVSIAVLGSLSTLVASFLARTGGTSEPESSLLREQALSHFIRRLRAFVLDCGTEDGHDQAVDSFRTELERLLHASNPNARKTPLFDPELKIDDKALGLIGLTEEDLALRRRPPRTAPVTGATGATDAK